MKKILFVLLIALFPSFICAQSAERLVKSAVAELKRSAYEGQFTLLYYSAANDVTDKQSGHITLKGDKFHITLGGNETKFDGKTQWLFVSDHNEVSITEPTQDELKEISPLAMIEYYIAKDRISESDNGEINFYPPMPKDSEYFRIALRINKSNLPSRLTIYQNNGDRITLVWDSLNKTKVDDEYFYFDATKYPNVEINDLR